MAEATVAAARGGAIALVSRDNCSSRTAGVATMGMNELILVGTGFVLARVLYVWYATPAPARKAAAKR